MKQEAPSRPESVVRQHLGFALLDYIAFQGLPSLRGKDEIGQFDVAVADRQNLLEVAGGTGQWRRAGGVIAARTLNSKFAEALCKTRMSCARFGRNDLVQEVGEASVVTRVVRPNQFCQILRVRHNLHLLSA